MSKITVNLQSDSNQAAPKPAFGSAPVLYPPVSASAAKPKKRRGILLKILLALFALLLIGAVVVGIAGWWWYSSLLKSPAYSLALLVDAAKKDDRAQVEQLLDTNAVVDDFVPQVIEKAKERFGRGFPPAQVAQAQAKIQPILQQIIPTVKERAKQQIPGIIKDKAQNIPSQFSSPMLLAVGIGRVATVEQTGDTATVKTDLQGRAVELKMQKNAADRWKIIGIKDDALADKIANDIAQKLLPLINQPRGGKNTAGKDLIEEIKRQVEQLKP